jgi:hypothetical protein
VKQSRDLDSLIAKANILSFPQIMVWGLVFVSIGGLTLWSSKAATTHSPGSTPASLAAAPNPATAYNTVINLSGCGYDSSLGAVNFKVVHSAGYTDSFNASVIGSGCLDGASFLTKEVGTYIINAYQPSSTHKNTSLMLRASTSINVK